MLFSRTTETLLRGGAQLLYFQKSTRLIKFVRLFVLCAPVWWQDFAAGEGAVTHDFRVASPIFAVLQHWLAVVVRLDAPADLGEMVTDHSVPVRVGRLTGSADGGTTARGKWHVRREPPQSKEESDTRGCDPYQGER